MGTLIRARGSRGTGQLVAWMPVVVLPVTAVWISIHWPAWVRMWLMAVAIYAGFKWLTFATAKAARNVSWAESLGYLLFWTGMDAEAFFRAPLPRGGVAGRASKGARPSALDREDHHAERDAYDAPRWSEWAWSVGQMAVGFWLLFGLAPRLVDSQPYVAGWVAMTGVVSVLHFGLSHLLSLVWRSFGVDARHIMDKPLLAHSASEFWGKRWNLAFRDLMHRFVLRPLAPLVGVGWAMVGVFVVSGVIHDVVISYTAGAGWGWPTLYFLIQATAVLLERSRIGRRMGLGSGWIGWLFALVVVAVPAGLLFHGPFIEHVVVPMVRAIGGLAL